MATLIKKVKARKLSCSILRWVYFISCNWAMKAQILSSWLSSSCSHHYRWNSALMAKKLQLNLTFHWLKKNFSEADLNFSISWSQRRNVKRFGNVLSRKKIGNKFKIKKFKIDFDFESREKSITWPTVWFNFTSEANLNELLIKMKLKNDHSIAFH